MSVPSVALWKRDRMRFRPFMLALGVLMGAAGCDSGASGDERRACDAARRLVASPDREALRKEVRTMVRAGESAGNDEMEEAARDFEQALDDRDQDAAQDAVGRFFAACEDAGVEIPVDGAVEDLNRLTS